jgi:hypothetical protein
VKVCHGAVGFLTSGKLLFCTWFLEGGWIGLMDGSGLFVVVVTANCCTGTGA